MTNTTGKAMGKTDLSSSQQPLIPEGTKEMKPVSPPTQHPLRRNMDTQKDDFSNLIPSGTSEEEPALDVKDLTGALQNMLQISGFKVDPAKPVLAQYANFTSALALKQVLYNKIHAITDCEPDTKSIFEMLMKDYMISVASDAEKISNERLAEQADSAKI